MISRSLALGASVLLILLGSVGTAAAVGTCGVIAVSNGHQFSLALWKDGTVSGWGTDASGQLGDPSGDDFGVPILTGMTGAIAIDAGGFHAMALTADGTVWAWGSSSSGQLGNGTNTSSLVPVKSLADASAISGGYGFSLAAKTDGTAWAWGVNGHGQLGDGTVTDSNIPVQVVGLGDVVAVSGGGGHSLALKADGTVWAWGANESGQVGDGTLRDSALPVEVLGLSDVVAISAGGFHSLALKGDGSVWAWGGDFDGQLGDGAGPGLRSTHPIEVVGLTSVVAIETGESHSLALRSDGSIWLWGSNRIGQLGNGTHVGSSVPFELPGAATYKSIGGGHGDHTIAIRTDDGTVWDWGTGSHGELGDGRVGSGVDSKVPVEAWLCNQAPICDFGGPYPTACRSIMITGATVTDPDGDAMSYSWKGRGDVLGAIVPQFGTLPDRVGVQVLPPTEVVLKATKICRQQVQLILDFDDGRGLGESSCTGWIVFDDVTPPDLVGVPADATVECTAVPPPAEPTETDDCYPDPAILFESVETPGTCPQSYAITRTWTAYDQCGNSTTASQVVTVVDTTAPAIAGIPPDETVECDAVPAPAVATVTDNCDSAPTLGFSERRVDGSCSDDYQLVRQWTAADACGNPAVKEQVVTVVDLTDPVATALLQPVAPRPPMSAHSACLAPTSRAFEVVCAATDNCDAAPAATALLRATGHGVAKDRSCTTKVLEVPVACGEIVEIQLLAPPCPARGPRSALVAVSVNSAGIKVVSGVAVDLEATGIDRCGNVGRDVYDPAARPSPLCDEVLDDATCCPAIGRPEDPPCKVPVCGGASTAVGPPRRGGRSPG